MYMTLYKKKPVFSLTKIRDNTTKIYFISTDNGSYFEIDFGKMCIGTDCQALSTFLLPIEMLSISVYRTLNEQTKSY